MGEAVKHLPDELRRTHQEVPWRSIAGFRDIAMHGYFSLVPPMVWNIVSENVPGVLEQILRVLAMESPPSVPE